MNFKQNIKGKNFKLKELHQLHILFPSLLLGVALSAQAETVIPDSNADSTFSDDTSYLINAGTVLGGTLSALTINGEANAKLTNHGAVGTASSNYGVNYGTNGAIVNETDGTITGVDTGLYIDSNATGAVDVTNKGDISSSKAHAVYYKSTGGTFTNYGTVGENSIEFADGVVVTDNDESSKVTIINEAGATIKTGDTPDGTMAAIEIADGYADVTNKGDIISSQCGVCASINNQNAELHVKNESTGVIQSGSAGVSSYSNSAVYFASDSSLDNAGKISSSTTYGVDFEGSNNSLINTGSISGGDAAHTAIYLKGNNNTVTLGTGSQLTDGSTGATAIQSVGTNNTVTLTGENSENGIITGLQQLTSEADSKWSLNGDVTLMGTTADTLNVNGYLTLDGTLTQTGISAGTTIGNGGTLVVGDSTHTSASMTGENITVAQGGTLSGTGMITGNIDNAGTVAVYDALAPNNSSSQLLASIAGPVNALTLTGNVSNSGNLNLAGTSPGNTMTITGDYTGTGGTVTLNTALGDDSSATDKLIIQGNSTGTSNLVVNNLGGKGAHTVQGIEVIDVMGSDSSGLFSLKGRAVAGAYEYSLVQNSTNGDWYLQSATDPTPEPTPEPEPTPAPAPATAPGPAQLRPEVGSYLANQQAAQSMFVNTLFDRMGDRFNNADANIDAAWGYISGKHTHQEGANGALDSKGDGFAMELGSDVFTGGFTENDRWSAGVMGGIGQTKTHSKVDGVHAESQSTVDGYNLGIYSTWFADAKTHTGQYVDSWYQYGWFSNKVNGDELEQESYDSSSHTASLETGYGFNLGESLGRGWILEPQAQAIYLHYDQDDHVESNGTRVTNGSGEGVLGRFGARLTTVLPEGKTVGIRPFIEANWWTGQPVADSVTMDGVTVRGDAPQNSYQLKAGLQGNLNANLQAWVNASSSVGENNYYDYGGTAGLRYQF